MTDGTRDDKNTDPSAEALESLGGLEHEAADDAELWSEFDQEESGAAAPDGEQEPAKAGDRTDPGAADDDSDWEGEETGSADQQGADPAASGPDGDEPSGHNDGDEEGADPFADATPEQRAAFEAAQERLRKLEQSERSQRGRVAALQRRLDEAARATPQPSAAAGEGANEEDPNAEFLASDDWKSFNEEYPEVAGPIGALIGKLQAQVVTQGKRLEAIGEDRISAAMEEQYAILEEAHSDWEDVVRDEGFQPWLAEQPRHIREAAARNASDIVDAEEAGDVIARYKAHIGATGAGSQQQGGRSGDGRPGGNGSGRRARQATSAKGGRPRSGPGVATGIPADGDEAEIWKAFDQQEEQEARRRA